MRLLVSVSNEEEARAALAGGADIIDAKDPQSGALGAVTLPVLQTICDAVGGARPVTAALGDAEDESTIERAAAAFAAAGARFVKIGFAGITSGERIGSLLAAAVEGARRAALPGPRDERHCEVVAVIYADVDPGADAIAEIAATAGARGVLLDTADKRGPGLRALMSDAALAVWVARAHRRGLFVAVAGKLTVDDLVAVRTAGADIAGVRGAACEGGRMGRVATHRVRDLVLRIADCGLRIDFGSANRPSAIIPQSAFFDPR